MSVHCALSVCLRVTALKCGNARSIGDSGLLESASTGAPIRNYDEDKKFKIQNRFNEFPINLYLLIHFE